MDAANELTRPLGVDRPATRSGAGPHLLRKLVLASSVAAVLAAGGAAMMFGDPGGGVPYADVAIERRSAPTNAAPAPSASGRAMTDPSRRDAAELEAAAGVSVVRGAGVGAPESIVVRVPDEGPVTLAPAPDGRLVDKTRHGLLPRIGSDGARAVAVYARPPGELPGGAPASARVAIVVGGLGISQSATADAIARLPAAVTLAFAPYGSDLDRHAARGRAAGHELLLQIPMEPFDYPDSDPGPRTLLVGARPADNLEHLHWAMGRFTGYVGLMNYMGGKLTADARALAPVLREAGERGLGILDDGSSSRSLLVSLAGDAPAARADLVLDAVPRADLIDKALQRLEAAAAGGAVAVATASALPTTIERIERWAKGLEARGVLLVPASAAMSQRTRESARR